MKESLSPEVASAFLEIQEAIIRMKDAYVEDYQARGAMHMDAADINRIRIAAFSFGDFRLGGKLMDETVESRKITKPQKDKLGYVIKSAEDWWTLFIYNKRHIIRILTLFLIGNPETKVEKAIKNRDSEILRDMNKAWGRAPDNPGIHDIPGWKAFCDLMSEDWVLYEEEQ